MALTPKQEAKELLKRLVPIWWIKKHSHPDQVAALEKCFGSVEEYDAQMRKVLIEIIER